ncbi:Hypothetical protein ETEE_3706 [Edwardsiella anguillarum ET080813]|uniref:Uncharacterized protein n=1 Tax=Edwardsiella anguillarum ET080813 TaxID=667120 RepID=A0A076LUI5_9GAMM|nr:Hypothetical protein ETEE_3706 [Edwardsiella anguillarum ET080813]
MGVLIVIVALPKVSSGAPGRHDAAVEAAPANAPAQPFPPRIQISTIN